MITLKVAETETKNPNNWQIQALINEGEINIALRIKDELGMEEAVRISGISREILELYDISE